MIVDINRRSERYLIFDESGNLGRDGRYFVLACIDTYDGNALHGIMRKKIKTARRKFPRQIPKREINRKKKVKEIKTSWAYPCVKYHILESILENNVRISYMVVDLYKVGFRLLENTNLLYEYMVKSLISNIIDRGYNRRKLNIFLDNINVAPSSKDSLENYLRIHLLYEKNLDLDIELKFIDSNSKEGYLIQAVDYVANTIYGYYEYGNGDLYFDLIRQSLDIEILYPAPRDRFKHFNKTS